VSLGSILPILKKLYVLFSGGVIQMKGSKLGKTPKHFSMFGVN